MGIEKNTHTLVESERCYVRRFMEQDLDDFTDYRNDLEWMRFQYFKGYTRAEYGEILLSDSSIKTGMQLAIIRKADNRLLGDVYVKEENDAFWIGYTIAPSFARQGYAYEVVEAVVLWIQQQGGVHVLAGVAPENKASLRLLEKLGFSYQSEEDGEYIFSLRTDLIRADASRD